MLKNLVQATYSTVEYYSLNFDDGHNNGFGFPCNERGELLPELPDAARENYRFCMENPERFKRFNKIEKHIQRVKNNAHGICECGNDVELRNDYMGACQCDKCGQWYNLFGQELLPPEQWEE